MLEIITGLPSPDLERELVRRLDLCRDVPMDAAVVVPSDEMRRHLRLALARDAGRAYLGLSILTAHALASRMLGRAGRGFRAAPNALLVELVRKILRGGAYPRLARLAETRGGPAALLSSLRDLAESCLDPQAPSSGDTDILRLYRDFDTARREASLWIHADLIRRAAREAGGLARPSRVFYYGFSDMTGAQQEFMRALADRGAVETFVPSGEGPAWSFARDFTASLKADVSTAAGREAARPCLEPAFTGLFVPGKPSAESLLLSRPKVISVSGVEAELHAAADEALRLVEEEGLRFDEIAVVARTLEPYASCLGSVFAERGVPFRSSAAAPAGAHPSVKAAHALIRVLRERMRRTDVIDLVSSPCFAHSRFGASESRSAYWELLSRQLHILGGMEAWATLAPIAEGGMTVVRRRDEDEIGVDPVAARELWSCVSAVIDECSLGPEVAGWDEHASSFRRAFDRLFDMPEGDPVTAELACALDELDRFAALGGKVARDEFLRAAESLVLSATVELGQPDAPGVEVLDAMAARCRGFRSVIVIGVNGGLWPRGVREDPFLPDPLRDDIARRRKVKLDAKRLGYEEERLVFVLALAAARESIAFIYSRSDDEGKPQTASWYLEELRRASGGERPFDESRVPRMFRERLAGARAGYLTPREWREGLVMQGERDPALWAKLPAAGTLLERSLAAADDLARLGRELGPRDGITGPLPGFFDRVRLRGFSPTSLERYASCPFSFFAAQVLRLAEVEEAEVVFEPAPTDRGTVLHAVLETFFRRLVACGHFEGQTLLGGPEGLLEECADQVFEEFERRIATGTPLVWERVKSELREVARVYVRRELVTLQDGGYVPFAFEVKDAAELPGGSDMPESLRGLKVYGYIDRLDRRVRDGLTEGRAVDYKFKGGAKISGGTLELGAVRGRSIQPPVYLLLAERLIGAGCAARSEFHFLAPRASDGPVLVREFQADCWKSPLGRQVAEALARIVEGISRGEWFLAESDRCNWCDFSAICRKSHSPTRYRIAADPRPAAHAALGHVKIEKPETKSPEKAAKKKAAKKKAARKKPANGEVMPGREQSQEDVR